MITPAIYEDNMQELESSHNYNKAISDTVTVLKQFGYDAGAELFKRLLDGADKYIQDNRADLEFMEWCIQNHEETMNNLFYKYSKEGTYNADDGK